MDDQAMEIDSDCPTPRPLRKSYGVPSNFCRNAKDELVSPESGKMMSMDEWDALFPPRQPEPAETPSEPVIVPLPAVPTTGEHVANFNNLCMRHFIAPQFTIQEISKGCFTARVEFGSHMCEEDGPFPSKKQAKEAVCRPALEILSAEEIPQRQKVPGANAQASKRKVQEDEENWVGILVEFCQKNKHPMPRYSDFEANLRAQQVMGLLANPKQFAYTVLLQAAPGQVFGSQEMLFNTKSEAKKNAAKEAVLWLRANNVMKVSDTPKQVKAKASTPDEQTRLTQGMARMNTNESVAQLVHDRSLQLGLQSPRFEMRPQAAPAGAVAPSFYTAWAWFCEQDVEKQPSLQGPLCQTEVVFGQKRAKEICSKELLGLLDRLVAQRAGGQAATS